MKNKIENFLLKKSAKMYKKITSRKCRQNPKFNYQFQCVHRALWEVRLATRVQNLVNAVVYFAQIPLRKPGNHHFPPAMN